eukprot:TRINITY_DN5096_c0_g1_i3.p1 TRINITY_DN5096_c0_g1~~TRINITY_DN5096_c0_g1_i3.p1  ORF type:complete len:415 (-),score=115.85 TRINITY_DN5096_c0_g1_i3:160-1404(-)
MSLGWDDTGLNSHDMMTQNGSSTSNDSILPQGNDNSNNSFLSSVPSESETNGSQFPLPDLPFMQPINSHLIPFQRIYQQQQLLLQEQTQELGKVIEKHKQATGQDPLQVNKVVRSAKASTPPKPKPNPVVKKLGPLLNPQGGVGSKDQMATFVTKMKQEKKTDVDAFYLSALENTQDTEALKQFTENGLKLLLEKLIAWKKEDKLDLIRQTLKIFSVLPITYELLANLKIGKLVNTLKKSSDKDIGDRATALVEEWKGLVDKATPEQIKKTNTKEKLEEAATKKRARETELENEKIKKAASEKIASEKAASIKRQVVPTATITAASSDDFDAMISESPKPFPKTPKTETGETGKTGETPTTEKKKHKTQLLETDVPAKKPSSNSNSTSTKPLSSSDVLKAKKKNELLNPVGFSS